MPCQYSSEFEIRSICFDDNIPFVITLFDDTPSCTFSICGFEWELLLQLSSEQRILSSKIQCRVLSSANTREQTRIKSFIAPGIVELRRDYSGNHFLSIIPYFS